MCIRDSSLPEVNSEVWFEISDSMADGTYLEGSVFNEKNPFGKKLSNLYEDQQNRWSTPVSYTHLDVYKRQL